MRFVKRPGDESASVFFFFTHHSWYALWESGGADGGQNKIGGRVRGRGGQGARKGRDRVKGDSRREHDVSEHAKTDL
jgi:hypothetical protein